MTASYIDRCWLPWGVSDAKYTGLGQDRRRHFHELSLGVFVLAFRVLFSVQPEAGKQLSACELQAGKSGASQVASVL